VTTKPPGDHTLSRGYEGRDLQHTHITHCSTLQHTATHCNTLQHTGTHGMHHTATRRYEGRDLQHTCITHYNALQQTQLTPHTVTYCNTLQHTATQRILQHTASNGNTLQHSHHSATHSYTLQHTRKAKDNSHAQSPPPPLSLLAVENAAFRKPTNTSVTRRPHKHTEAKLRGSDEISQKSARYSLCATK